MSPIFEVNKLISDINMCILSLREMNIFILTGELDDFYKVRSKYKKEARVIETISRKIEEDENIYKYIEINEFIAALKIFVQKCLHLELIESAYQHFGGHR